MIKAATFMTAKQFDKIPKEPFLEMKTSSSPKLFMVFITFGTELDFCAQEDKHHLFNNLIKEIKSLDILF